MKKLILIATFLLGLNLSATKATAETWELLGEFTSYEIYYIEPSSVVCDKLTSDEVIFHAFLKAVYNEEGRKELIRFWVTNHGYIPPDAYRAHHSIFLEYFKWANGVKYYAIDAETVYTTENSVIYEMSYSRPYHRWKVALPGSISDALFFAVGERLKL